MSNEWNPNHLHLLVIAKQEKQLMHRRDTRLFLSDVIDAAGMTCISGPHTEFVEDPDNYGPTGAAILSTSHTSVHSWPNRNLMQMDLYSCCEFNVNEVLYLFQQFGMGTVEILLVDRNDGYKVLRDEKIIL